MGDTNHTHCYNNAKKAPNYPVHHSFQLGIACSSAVQRPVCVLILHSKAKEIWFCDNEVEILVVELCNLL